MLAQLGIGARLFIAFVGVAALSLSSGVAGWMILREVSLAQSRITAEALPAVEAAQRTAAASARLVATAPALTAARDEAERAHQEEELRQLAVEVRQGLPDPVGSTLDPESARALSSTVEGLIANLAAQNRLVKERLRLQAEFDNRTERAIAAATAIVDLSETLVSNASAGASAVVSSLYGLIDDEKRREEAYDALDRLIEQDIFLLDRMSELRLRSSQIGLLANRLTRALDRGEVGEIATIYLDHLRVVRRRIASIDDPVRREQAASFLSDLEASGDRSPGARNLFDSRIRLVEIGEDLDRLASANRALSADLGRIAQDVLARSETFAQSVARQADSAVSAGLWVLLGTSLVAVLVSALIVWRYVERGIVRRLARLTGALRRLTNGDLDVAVDDEDSPELNALSNAVRAFRDESQQRRDLEIEREKTHEELRRHREELQELVGERTEQLQTANERLQQEVESHAVARERAESSSRAKSAFLATMSHEIRTPMTGLIGMLQIMNDETLPTIKRQQLAVASKSSEALLGILNGILDYSKIEAGKLELEPVIFDLRETCSGICDLMRPAASMQKLAMTTSLDRGLGRRYRGDVGKIRQILFNLIGNAIKFTDTGSVSFSAVLAGEENGIHRVAFAVRDTGIGIAEDQRAAIFEAFTQGDASATRRHGGTGLGLAISRNLALILGGTLEVDSAVGQGSTFTLTLPLETAPGKAPRRRLGKAARPAGRLLILVVEDDDATQLVARAFLERLGHDVIVVGDGFAAVEAAQERVPDLVVMDISLPGIDGIEAARRLRAVVAETLPIVAISAHVFRDEIDRYLASGMNAFIGKPLTPEALAAGIAEAMRMSGPVRIDTSMLREDLASLGAETVARILRMAEETLPQRFREMRLALEAGDWDRVAAAAHAAGSSASSAGLSGVHARTREIEAAARQHHAAVAEACLSDCEVDFEAALSQARRLVDAEG